MADDFEFERLRRRIAEVAEWCRRSLRIDDLANSLRTAELAPPHNEAGELIITARAVAELGARRSALLRASRVNPIATQGIPKGRLLLFDPDASLSDGAAAAATQFLFDDNNAPPWDTIVAYVSDPPQSAERWTPFDSYVVCWIPADVAALTARAIEVNAEKCLAWADEVERPSLHRFVRASLAIG